MEVQFKFGDIWQYEYVLGARILLEKKQEAWVPEKLVIADGIGGPCPACGTEFLDFDVYIQRGVIESVTPHSADFTYGAETYVVREPWRVS
ncbi:hypothetical protein [Corallococcus terminator]|uniref:Uncharacterized protein n=1 Tax=Corallococcus terminator TaxID=2316733 RepID=A0A3A8IVZ1_9BACT|nr:hypothetical protein [Corallococcus terminator]RKG84014.1 hypothetical protein D7V88_22890 [Corallococcus terminator]